MVAPGAGRVKTLRGSEAPAIFDVCGLAERENTQYALALRGYKGSLAEFSHSLGGERAQFAGASGGNHLL
jgi:hypothetical protein